MKKTCVLAIAGLLILFASCFSHRQAISVIGYRHQTVYLKKDLFYKVGPLSEGWQKFNVHAKAAAFHNKDLGATISTDAFCGSAFEDIPLKTLTGQLFAGTARHSTLSEKEFQLDGRGALRTVSTGEVDGVPLKFDSVVIKKNNCTIDFVYMSPPERYAGGVGEFESFFGGFRF
jgi:hypothetical protein